MKADNYLEQRKWR